MLVVLIIVHGMTWHTALRIALPAFVVWANIPDGVVRLLHPEQHLADALIVNQ